MTTPTQPALLNLPTELLQHIVGYFEALDLVAVSRVCRSLHTLSQNDKLWRRIAREDSGKTLVESAPFATFRELYSTHHPHWFIPRSRIWYADNYPNGKLIIARYDTLTGAVLAHQVVAARTALTLLRWEKCPDVIIHTFSPRLALDMHQPVVKLHADSPRIEDRYGTYPSDRGYGPPSSYTHETLMDVFSDAGLYASLMLCRSLPNSAITEQTRVWPPLNIPSISRTRNETRDGYNSAGHRPSTYSEVSQCNFRLRKWAEYTGRRATPNMSSYGPTSQIASVLGLEGPYFSPSRMGGGMSIRMPEDITTYATIPPEHYTPTPQKPYQGIWCGDYSGHGCEFILLTQPDKAHERPLPRGLDWLLPWFRGGRRGSTSSGSSVSSYSSAQEYPHFTEAAVNQVAQLGVLDGLQDFVHALPNTATPASLQLDADQTTDYPDVPTGRLEAIKLTGDINVPRGEYTWVAPELGHEGFVRVADEEIFRGARIVRSAGHIAGRDFVEDQYTPSQLILISHDILALFWEGFGHISYYNRVDLDALEKLAAGAGP